MTKNERATLEANLKLVWRIAINSQESAKSAKDDAKEKAARAKGYREACIDVLGYSYDGKSGATDEVQKWIDEAEQQAGATLTAGWMK